MMALPAYDQCIKASHVLQSAGCARRDLGDRAAELHPAGARTRQACGEAWLTTEAGGRGWPDAGLRQRRFFFNAAGSRSASSRRDTSRAGTALLNSQPWPSSQP